MSRKKARYVYYSDDSIAQYALTQSFLADKPKLDFLSEHAHLISQFLHFAQREDSRIQIAGVRGLQYFSGGISELTQQVLEYGSLPVLGSLIQTSANSKIKEMALYIIGNIACDSVASRDAVLNSNVRVIIKELSTTLFEALRNNNWQDQIGVLRGLAFALSQLSRGKPSPILSLLAPFFAFLSKLLFVCNTDKSILTDTLFAFSYISDGKERIQAVLYCGILPKLLELIDNCEIRDKDTFIQPMIRLLGNIATGDESQTQTLIDSGALISIRKWIHHPKPVIRKETIWVISNMVAESETQIQAVIDLGILPQLLEIVKDKNNSQEILKEIVWVMRNIFERGSADQISILLDLGVVKVMSGERLFTVGDAEVFSLVLNFYKHLLEKSTSRNLREQVKDSMKQVGIPEMLRASLNSSQASHQLDFEKRSTINFILRFFV